MDHGSPRIRAARWVIGLGRLSWGLVVAGAAWALLGAVFAGSPGYLLMSLVLAGLAAVWGALVRGFEAHRRGAWSLLVVLTAGGVLEPVAGVLAGRPMTLLGALSAAVSGPLLGLLLHRDSREWVAPDEPRRSAASPSASHPGGGHWQSGQRHRVPGAG